jgi:hypothetical protein
MNKNAGWVVTVVILSIMLIVSLVFGSGGLLGSPAPTDTAVPAVTIEVKPSKTPLPTTTPNPCSSENIEATIKPVHVLTREFEDTAQVLTSTLMSNSSVPLVQDLQRIRREAEDQVVPSCLEDLKQYQIIYMNARIDVFGNALTFINMYGTNQQNQAALNQVLEPLYAKSAVATRQYENELARLMGKPPLPTIAVVTITPKP